MAESPTASASNAIALHGALADTQQRQHVEKMLSELLITVSDKVFEKKTITIDGYRFINCSFIECKLYVMRGTFEFHHCVWRPAPGPSRIFDESSLKTIQFFVMNDVVKHNVIPAFGAKMHPDGSFSIAKGASFSA